MVDQLYEQCNRQESNPRKLKRVILADDDALCQATVKKMIEDFGGYEVLPFFNGPNVCYLSYIS